MRFTDWWSFTLPSLDRSTHAASASSSSCCRLSSPARFEDFFRSLGTVDTEHEQFAIASSRWVNDDALHSQLLSSRPRQEQQRPTKGGPTNSHSPCRDNRQPLLHYGQEDPHRTGHGSSPRPARPLVDDKKLRAMDVSGYVWLLTSSSPDRVAALLLFDYFFHVRKAHTQR